MGEREGGRGVHMQDGGEGVGGEHLRAINKDTFTHSFNYILFQHSLCLLKHAITRQAFHEYLLVLRQRRVDASVAL